MVEIKGFIENTLLDYPGKIASTIFFGGCNFRCPFCHNPALVLHPDTEQTLPTEEILETLASPLMKKWVDGICLTGGEPTLQADLEEFCAQLKNLGYLVKLDTNGTNPQVLEKLFSKKLVDYVAMDIKAPLEKYDAVCGAKVDKKAIQKSVDLIRASGIDYEFRTTAVPGLFSKEDALEIGKWLSGSKKFFLQQFRGINTLDSAYAGKAGFTHKELNGFAEMLKPFFGRVGVRGA
ncbi:MAG: anaerobic ribonucleoside-triphosphate reductase activating protein [Candidatus Micrarchaeia archaeon]|jgi:pyruvate formate lyase activating enzyme